VGKSALDKWRDAHNKKEPVVNLEDGTRTPENANEQATLDAAREWESSGYSEYMEKQRKNGWKT
jgi:hypothetical protein